MSRAFSKMEGKLRSSEAESLLTLLQDRDEVALALVRDRIMFLGWPTVSYCFENLTRVVPSDRRAAVRRFLHSISSSCSVDELERLLEEGNFFFVPDGLYYLSRILMPELTPGDFHESYLELAGDLMGELRDNMTAVEKVEMLNYIVFERYGFQLSRGGMDGYEDRILLPEIMERRMAGVVGLSAVYFLLASYAGLPVYPVFPREPGYYVAYFEDGRTLFSMDMGNRGHITDPVPRRSWLDTDFMGTDRTILYLYATALRRFGRQPLAEPQVSLLERAIDDLRL